MAIAGIGDAVAHQDKPNLFASQAAGALARMSAEESRREAARRKAQEKDEADIKKVIGDADIYSKNTTWHKMYAPAVQREMADFANDYINYKTQNPNAPGNGAYAVTKLQELQGRLNRLKQNNDAFKEFEKGVHEGKYYADPDLFKKIYETDFSKKLYRDDNGRVVSGDWGGLKPNDLYGAMIDANGDFISNPVKKFDFQKTINSRMNNSNYWTSTGITIKPRKGVPNAYDEVQYFQEDPTQRESFVDEMTSNPDAVRAWQIENKDRLNEARKNNPSLNNDRNYSDFVQEQMAGDIRLKASGRKQTSKISHFAAPKAAKAKEDAKVVNVEASSPRTLSVGVSYNTPSGETKGRYYDSGGDEYQKKADGKLYGKDDKTGEFTKAADPNIAIDFKPSQAGAEITAKRSATFNAVNVQHSPKFSVDMETGKSYVPRGVVEYDVSSVDELPYVKDKDGTVILVDDKTGDKIKSKKGKVQYGWFAVGQETAGTKGGEKVRKPSAIPLTRQLYDVLKGKKVNVTNITDADFWDSGSAKASVGLSKPNEIQATPSTSSAPNVNSANNAPDQYISSILDFENSKGYKNFGFTSHSGTLNKSQATEKFKKEYLPMIEELPVPLQAVAGDFAFNSEDPRASLLVAAGNITPEQKKKLYVNGKLDKAKLDDLWNNGENDVIALFNDNSKDFLDEFDKERLRSYKGTNGADKKFSEWAERVKVSRKVADKLLGGSNEVQEFVVKGKKYRVPANEVAAFKKDMGL